MYLFFFLVLFLFTPLDSTYAFSKWCSQMSLCDIKRTIAIWVVTTLPAVPPVRKQKSIAFSMLSPKIKIFGGPMARGRYAGLSTAIGNRIT